jgi:hypothetical protein
MRSSSALNLAQFGQLLEAVVVSAAGGGGAAVMLEAVVVSAAGGGGATPLLAEPEPLSISSSDTGDMSRRMRHKRKYSFSTGEIGGS